MDTTKRSPLDRLLFATFLKGRTSSRDIWEEKGDMTPEDNQKIIEETNEINNSFFWKFEIQLEQFPSVSIKKEFGAVAIHGVLKILLRYFIFAFASLRTVTHVFTNVQF